MSLSTLAVSQWILARLTPPAQAEALIGDLLEERRLRLQAGSHVSVAGWYWRQLASSVRAEDLLPTPGDYTLSRNDLISIQISEGTGHVEVEGNRSGGPHPANMQVAACLDCLVRLAGVHLRG